MWEAIGNSRIGVKGTLKREFKELEQPLDESEETKFTVSE